MLLLKSRKILSWLIVLFGLLSVRNTQADATGLTRFEYTEYHMGVDVRIVVYAPDAKTAERGCAAAFERFAELDTIMSDYRADSELMRLCAQSGGPPVPVSKDLFRVLLRARQVARQSGGAFDVTCGPLVALWRKARKTLLLPTPEAIEQARKLVGWQKMRLNPSKHTAQLLVPGMKLDLGGIGKGYADDCAQQVLKRRGITRALVEAGGDIVVSGPPPGEAGWKIQVPNAVVREEGTGNREQETQSKIENRKSAFPSSLAAPVLLFANVAVSTSGDTEQFVDIDGKRYSHILDPRNGQALTSRVQVTIIARNGITSDSLSKVASLLEPDASAAIIKLYPGTTAYIRKLSLNE